MRNGVGDTEIMQIAHFPYHFLPSSAPLSLSSEKKGPASANSVTSFGPSRGAGMGSVLSRRKFGEVACL